MAMTMNKDAPNVAPPSPAASPRSSPLSSDAGRNLKVDNGTQPAHEDIQPLPATLFDAWNRKHNQRSTPLMTRKDFKRLVQSVLLDSGNSGATDSALEAALAERVQRETHKLTTELELIKREVFLGEDIPEEVDDLLPLVQHEAHHRLLQYIIKTLSVLPQLYSTQQPATKEPPPAPNPPPVLPQPQPSKRRATRIEKTHKRGSAAPVRRSDRIRMLTRNTECDKALCYG